MSELTDRLRKEYPAGAHHKSAWSTCQCCDDAWPCEWSETFVDVNEATDRIDCLEAEVSRLRHAIAACVVGWDDGTPPHGPAIVAALERALDQT